MRRYIEVLFAGFIILVSLVCDAAPYSDPKGSEEVALEAARLLDEAIERNRQNDRLGLSHRNNYIIEVNLNEDWIEERGSGTKVIQSKYKSISEQLKEFNTGRPDKLRAYVVVVNDWQLRLKQHVDIGILPSTVDFDALAKESELSHLAEKDRIYKEVGGVPESIRSKLRGQGYTDMAIYFGAAIRLYTVGQDGKPTEKRYKYGAVSLTGSKLKPVKDQVRAKIARIKSLQLEDEIEIGVITMTEAIREVVDQKQPLVLANKVPNATINDWYLNVGEKSVTPFSGVTNDQLYDYTGVFEPMKDKIIGMLPDPTAKVVITDNLTSDATINNIKTVLSKPLGSNVFWFHLDRKGVLHTEVFLAETVKQRLGELGADVAGDVQLYITKIYEDSGPKIRSAADLIDFFNIEAHLFKAISKLLGKARIPNDWWNASHPDYLLGVFGEMSPNLAISFAYVCGVWNGIIDNLSMVSEFMTFQAKLRGAFFKILVDPQYRNDLLGDLAFYWDNLGILTELAYEIIKAEVVKTVKDEWEKLMNGDATSIGYVAGVATVEVVIAILTAGIVDAAKAGLMSFKLIRIPVEFITKIGRAMVRPIAWMLKAGGKIVMEGVDFLLKQGEEVIARLTSTGKLIIYKVLAAGEKIVDEIPILIRDVEWQGGAAALKFSWVRTPTGWGFKKRSEFLEALGKSLSKYPSLHARVINLKKEFQDKFIDDFLTNIDDNLLAQLEKDPSLIEGWRRLDGSPLRMHPKYMTFAKQLPASYQYVPNGDIVKVLNAQGEELAELSADMVKAKGGIHGSWNEILNKPTIPNHKYLVDNYLYETDDLGRVNKVKGKLEDIERGRNEYQQGLSVSLKDGIKGTDDGGHLLANILNGPGEQINYLPMHYNLNRGKWRMMEDAWSQALRRGEVVEVEIIPMFNGSSKRPFKFIVRENVGGKQNVLDFPNN